MYQLFTTSCMKRRMTAHRTAHIAHQMQPHEGRHTLHGTSLSQWQQNLLPRGGKVAAQAAHRTQQPATAWHCAAHRAQQPQPTCSSSISPPLGGLYSSIHTHKLKLSAGERKLQQAGKDTVWV